MVTTLLDFFECGRGDGGGSRSSRSIDDRLDGVRVGDRDVRRSFLPDVDNLLCRLDGLGVFGSI